MSKTQIDGDRILDGSVQRKDIDISTPGESVITKVIPDTGLEIISSTGTDAGTGDVTVRNRSLNFGQDFASTTKSTPQTVSGGTFQTYHTLNFNVTDGSPNQYRLNIDFIWGHDSAANDVRFAMYLDGAAIGPEIQVEPKDAGTDQRDQNNILVFGQNLATGSHTLELRFRPDTASRETTVYNAVIEAWRTI